MRTIRDAREQVKSLFVSGLLLSAGGYLVAIFAWPHTEREVDIINGGFTPVDKGSAGLAWIGLGVAGAAQIMVFIAIVAWGVRLGMESVRQPHDELLDVEDAAPVAGSHAGEPHPEG